MKRHRSGGLAALLVVAALAFAVPLLAGCGGLYTYEANNVTGGGWFLNGEQKVTFAFQAKLLEEVPDVLLDGMQYDFDVKGNFEYNDRAEGIRLHGIVDTMSVFSGYTGFTGTYRSQPKNAEGLFTVMIQDLGEPGWNSGDWIYVSLDGGATYEVVGILEGGNVQYHAE